MATVEKQRTFHGNHGIITIDGVEIGRVQGVNCNTDSSADYVYEVGEFDPVEINHNKGSYRITVDTFVLREGAQSVLHRFPIALGDIPAMEIACTDRENGTEFTIYGAEPTASSANVRASTRVSHNVTMMALGIRDGEGNRGSQNNPGNPDPFSSRSDDGGVTGNLPRILGS